MTKPEFLALVIKYGNACFDCGEHDNDDAERNYEALNTVAEAALKAIGAAVDEHWRESTWQAVDSDWGTGKVTSHPPLTATQWEKPFND